MSYYICKCLEPMFFNCAWCNIEFVPRAAIELLVKKFTPSTATTVFNLSPQGMLVCCMLNFVMSLAQTLASLFCHVMGGCSQVPQLSRKRLVGRHPRLPQHWMLVSTTDQQKPILFAKSVFSSIIKATNI